MIVGKLENGLERSFNNGPTWFNATYRSLRLLCTFRGGFSLTDVAPLSYITDAKNLISKLKLIELGIQIFHCFSKQKTNKQTKKKISRFSVESKLEGPDRRARVPTQCDFSILKVCFLFSLRQDPKSLTSAE